MASSRVMRMVEDCCGAEAGSEDGTVAAGGFCWATVQTGKARSAMAHAICFLTLILLHGSQAREKVIPR